MSTGVACRTLDRRTGTVPVDGCGLQGRSAICRPRRRSRAGRWS
ncbi:hypothetical protein NKH77_38880 [Streptomyces sp. M19]